MKLATNERRVQKDKISNKQDWHHIRGSRKILLSRYENWKQLARLMPGNKIKSNPNK